MAENACSHLYVVTKRQIKHWKNFLYSGNSSQGNDRQKWIISDAFGAEESSSNFIFNDELVFK